MNRGKGKDLSMRQRSIMHALVEGKTLDESSEEHDAGPQGHGDLARRERDRSIETLTTTFVRKADIRAILTGRHTDKLAAITSLVSIETEDDE